MHTIISSLQRQHDIHNSYACLQPHALYFMVYPKVYGGHLLIMQVGRVLRCVSTWVVGSDYPGPASCSERRGPNSPAQSLTGIYFIYMAPPLWRTCYCGEMIRSISGRHDACMSRGCICDWRMMISPHHFIPCCNSPWPVGSHGWLPAHEHTAAEQVCEKDTLISYRQ